MTIQSRIKRWVCPAVFAIIFFSCIVIMITAPTEYRFIEDGKQINIMISKDKETAKVKIVDKTFGKTVAKYATTSITTDEGENVVSFFDGMYFVSENGNLRVVARDVEIRPQMSMRYQVAAAVLISSIALAVCIAIKTR